MRPILCLMSLAAALCLQFLAVQACEVALPPYPPVVGESQGVNIHFRGTPAPGVLQSLSALGITFIRMDFSWSATEYAKGQYNFTEYDELISGLQSIGMTGIFILDYRNALYDGGLSPYTEEGITAFATWAAAAVKHFDPCSKGKGILWEMYNEPNGGFWKPHANVTAYINLALATGKAIKAAAPSAAYVGPATSTIDMNFLNACFEAGLLQLWDAVTVHPYRDVDPETVSDEWRTLRASVDHYSPAGKFVPLISSEWGYSSTYGHFDEARQGKVVPRMWLTNMMNNITLSIYYDFNDDGTSQTYTENHFGLYYQQYSATGPAYQPKPAFFAASTFTSTFRGMRYACNMTFANNATFVYILKPAETSASASTISLQRAVTLTAVDVAGSVAGSSVQLLKGEIMAAWCTDRDNVPCHITFKVGDSTSSTCFTLKNYLGHVYPNWCAEKGFLTLALDDGPYYLSLA